MKKRFTEEQIIGILQETESGLPVAELCRRHGFSKASYYLWRSKFGGMQAIGSKYLETLDWLSPTRFGGSQNEQYQATGRTGDVSPTFERQVNKLHIRAAILNQFTELGLPQKAVV